MSDPSKLRLSVSDLQRRPRAQVLIIGGGINGLGTLRDLALQGVDVLLVERDDFVSGASSASSHMIHGGVRYLENGEFRLVHESVTERNRLLRLAPHFVKPLPTTIPIFSTFSGALAAPIRFIRHGSGKPKERGAVLIKAGLTLYDIFSRDGGAVARHRFYGRKKSLTLQPQLNPELKFTATYFDASCTNPELLALDVLQDALDAGGRAINYLAAVAVREGAVVLRDALTGSEFTVSADVVVNTTGQWTDLTNGALGSPSSFMGGTKGSHIVLDHPELLAACAGREMFFENDDGRIVLIYPLKGRVMIGTTDLDVAPDERICCTSDEIDYFIELAKHVFPGIRVSPEQIVYSFSGVRPLPRHDDTAPGFVSRDYRIVNHSIPGLGRTHALSLVGGKWTTFRALSEHLSSTVLKLIGMGRTVSTKNLPIGGGLDFPRDEADRDAWVAKHGSGLAGSGGTYTNESGVPATKESGIPTSGASFDSERAAVLLERYGTRATQVIKFLRNLSSDTPLEGDASYTTGEILYLIRQTQVERLADLFLRRTDLAFTGALNQQLLIEVSELLGQEKSWSSSRLKAERTEFLQLLTENHPIPSPRQLSDLPRPSLKRPAFMPKRVWGIFVDQLVNPIARSKIFR